MQKLIEKLAFPETQEDFIKGISLRPRIIKKAGIDYIDIFTLEDFDRIMSITGLRPPFVSLINGRTGLRSTDYFTYHESAIQGSHPSKMALELIRNGTTIIIQHVHLLHPGVRAFAENLCKAVHPFSVQINCYLAPENAQGVIPHIDQHHTLLLQLSGRKRWCVWENIDENPTTPMINTEMEHDRPIRISEQTEPLINDWVETGDFILMPRGFIHTPYTGNTHSLHLTFGIIDPGEHSAADLFFRQITTEENIASLYVQENDINIDRIFKENFLNVPQYIKVV